MLDATLCFYPSLFNSGMKTDVNAQFIIFRPLRMETVVMFGLFLIHSAFALCVVIR